MKISVVNLFLASILLVLSSKSASSLENHNRNTPKTEFIWLPIVFYTPETSTAVGVLNVANLWIEKLGKTSSIFTTAFLSAKGQKFYKYQSEALLCSRDP